VRSNGKEEADTELVVCVLSVTGAGVPRDERIRPTHRSLTISHPKKEGEKQKKIKKGEWRSRKN